MMPARKSMKRERMGTVREEEGDTRTTWLGEKEFTEEGSDAATIRTSTSTTAERVTREEM
jgi:hypothetical protein